MFHTYPPRQHPQVPWDSDSSSFAPYHNTFSEVRPLVLEYLSTAAKATQLLDCFYDGAFPGRSAGVYLSEHPHMPHTDRSSQSGPPAGATPSGPPYAPTTAGLGGLATVDLDVPITAVFLFLFLLGGIAHMTIFQLNRRRGHKFLMSGAMFGFCMARIVTCIMRIVWATRPMSVQIAMAAQVFVAAGVLLLFVINLLFAQRMIRAAHPHSGWHPAFSAAFKVLWLLIPVTLFLLIAFVVLQFYTLDPTKRRISHDVQLYGATLFATVAFLPIPLVLGGLVIPRKTRLEKFGSGRYRSKIYILLTASFLLSLGAWFRTATSYLTPRPPNDPAWYQSKACFYVFNFSVEILVIWLYILVRVDRRFYVPNGSKGAGDYLGVNKEFEMAERVVVTRIRTEEETFDDDPQTDAERQHDVEGRALTGTDSHDHSRALEDSEAGATGIAV